jgi:hypothetical protein
MRLFFVFLMLGSFAIAFAELVRRSNETSSLPEPAASRCGDAVGTICSAQRILQGRVVGLRE